MGDEGEGLAAWLRAQMARRKLSQRQLARYAGISVGTISAILRSQVTPRPELVIALAEYFEVDPLEALAQNGLSALDSAPPEARAEAAELLRRLYALKPADRQGILRQLNEILDFLERAALDAGPARRGLSPRRVVRRRDARAKR